MYPLQIVAAMEGLAVVVARHERKAGGDVGDSARGGSAFAGAVDTILSIRRPNGNQPLTFRTIRTFSRDSGQSELTIELTPHRLRIAWGRPRGRRTRGQGRDSVGCPDEGDARHDG